MKKEESMKRTFKRIALISMILLVSVAGLFANGASEEAADDGKIRI